MERVLVTGACGLVGYRVAEMLHEAGADVLGVDLRPGATPFPCVAADAADLPRMRALVSDRPNVVHAGAVSGPMLMLDDPYGIAQANLGGAMGVFEACWQAGVRRLVWTSSIAVYGDQPTLDPISEEARVNPQSFYGHTKAAGEILLHAYVARYGVPAVALRLSSVYGVRRRTEYSLRAVIEAGLGGRPAPVAAEGTSFRQYLHVDDAARSVLLALAAEASGQIFYNVTGGTYLTEAALAAMIGEIIPGLAVLPGPPAWNEGYLGPLVTEAARRDLGYVPMRDLRAGLAELVTSFAAHVPA
jgi:nucleoside-diphosphate-sugar epimerase